MVMLEPGVSAEAIFKGLLEAGYFCGFSEQFDYILLYFHVTKINFLALILMSQIVSKIECLRHR